MGVLTVLHTSDWHLGRSLYGRKRYDEFDAFLTWLSGIIGSNGVSVLLVAGDVFDTTAPSNQAQALYYRFLGSIAASGCRHVVIVAGNHDSPSFLDAPRDLLRALDVHVVGMPSVNPADEVLLLRDAAGQPELVVCAVPYLRDRDIRQVDAGEGVADKERKRLEGIEIHYAAVVAEAVRVQKQLASAVPMVAMGHLFTVGARTVEGDGVRELYVGSLAHVPVSVFPETLSYVALGHLHVPQRVGGSETVRYSGSPLPMGFGEAKSEKSVVLAAFRDGEKVPAVTLVPVPRFQELERIRGDWNVIERRIRELLVLKSSVLLEVIYEGTAVPGDLRERLAALVADGPLEILRIRNDRVVDRVLERMDVEELLDSLMPEEVFRRCLDAHEVPEGAQRDDLALLYRFALALLEEEHGDDGGGSGDATRWHNALQSFPGGVA